MAVEPFNEQYYLAQNPDVFVAVNRGLFKSGKEHYQQYGDIEGRKPNAVFDPRYYREANPDVLEAVSKKIIPTFFDHYVLYGSTEIKLGEKSGAETPDKAFRAPNKEIAALIEKFDGEAYLKAHSDVTGFNAKTAVRHYLSTGKEKGYEAPVKAGGGTTPGNVFAANGGALPIYLDAITAQGVTAVSPADAKGLSAAADTIYGGGYVGDNTRIEDANKGDGDVLDFTLSEKIAPVVKGIETLAVRVKGTAGELDFVDISGTTKVDLKGGTEVKLLNVDSGIEYTLSGPGIKGLTIRSGSKNTNADAATLTLKGGVDPVTLDLGADDKDDIDQLTINNSGTNRVDLKTAFTKDESITVKGTSGLALKSNWSNVKDAVLKAEGTTTFGLEIADAFSGTASGVTYPINLSNNLSGFDQLTLLQSVATPGSVTVNGLSSAVKTVVLNLPTPTTGSTAVNYLGGDLTLTGLQVNADGTPVKDANGNQANYWSGKTDSLTLSLQGSGTAPINIGGKLSVNGIETLTIDSGSVSHTIVGLGLDANAKLMLKGSGALGLGAVGGGGNTIDASALGGGVTLILTAPGASSAANLYPSNTVITSDKADSIGLSSGRDVIVFNSTKGAASFGGASVTGYDTFNTGAAFSTTDDKLQFGGDYGFTSKTGVKDVATGVRALDFSAAKALVITDSAGGPTGTANDLVSWTKVGGLLSTIGKGQKGLVLIKEKDAAPAAAGVYYVDDSHGATLGTAADGIIQADEVKLVGVFTGDLYAGVTVAALTALEGCIIVG